MSSWSGQVNWKNHWGIWFFRPCCECRSCSLMSRSRRQFLTEESAWLQESDPSTNLSDTWESRDHWWGIRICEILSRKQNTRKFRWKKSAARGSWALQPYADYPWAKPCMCRSADLNTKGTTRVLNLASSSAVCSAAWDPLSVSCLPVTSSKDCSALAIKQKGFWGQGVKEY